MPTDPQPTGAFEPDVPEPFHGQTFVTLNDLEAVSYACGLVTGPHRDEGLAQVERSALFTLRNRIRMALQKELQERGMRA